MLGHVSGHDHVNDGGPHSAVLNPVRETGGEREGRSASDGEGMDVRMEGDGRSGEEMGQEQKSEV